jgi:very-short-patch-repair endonuclease
MNEDRRAAQRLGGLANTQNLLTPAEALRRREAQKYELLSVDLTERSIRHQFEYPMEDSVFDLALPDHRILVEFDGPYHRDEATTARDHFKDRLAHRHGWAVLRLLTPPGILGPDVLCALLRDLARAGVSQASLPVPSFTAPNEESSQRGEA